MGKGVDPSQLSDPMKQFEKSLRKALQDLFPGIPPNDAKIQEWHNDLFEITEYRLKAHEDIDNKYNEWKRFLGDPTKSYGYFYSWVYREYERGAIYWHSERGIYVVEGPIYKKYVELGAHKGFLGYPVTDRTKVSNSVGVYNDFDNGSIYWHPGIGAHEIHGMIRDKWRAVGATETLGFALTDETEAGDGFGRFNHFRNFLSHTQAVDASIYWTPALGAYEIHGAIREHWAKLGWETSYLGYPISDEIVWKDSIVTSPGRASRFQRGIIFWLSNSGRTTALPESIVLDAYPLNFSGPITGWAKLVLNSDGSWRYSGHLHDSSDFVGFHVRVASVLDFKTADGRVLAFGEETHVGGLFDNDDHDWDQPGSSPLIRDNFDVIRFRGMHTSTSVNLGLDDVALLAAEIATGGVIIGGASLLIWAFSSGKLKPCPYHRGTYIDPGTGTEKAYGGHPIVPGDEKCPAEP
jgi:hypothetical protein